MASPLDDKLDQLRMIAARYGVRRLDLIGSAARPDFDPRHSDLDFVVEFAPNRLDHPDPTHPQDDHLADRYFGLLHALEDLFQRPVDLISYRAIRNPFFKQVVDQTRQTLYAA